MLPRGATPVGGQGQKPRGPHAQRVAAKRSYPTSEVRAVAESARLRWRRNGQEKPPHVRGGVGGAAKKRYPVSEVRGGDERSCPVSEVRGGSREELPHAPTPEARGSGREDQPHARGQGQWPGGPSPVVAQVQEALREAIPF